MDEWASVSELSKKYGIPLGAIYKNTYPEGDEDIPPPIEEFAGQGWNAGVGPSYDYMVGPKGYAMLDAAREMADVIDAPKKKFSDVIDQALVEYMSAGDGEMGPPRRLMMPQSAAPRTRSMGSPAAPRDRSGSGERIRRGQVAQAAARPMSEQDYYDEEAEQVAAAAQAYEAGLSARAGAEPAAGQRDRSGSGERIRRGQVAQAAARPMSEQDYYDEEAEQVAAAAQAYEAGLSARAGAEPAAGQRDRSGSGERIAEGQREQWINTLKADFEVAHGTSYNPNSTMDQAKMGVLANARRMYPNATPTQLALKLYRGEFD